MTYVIEDSSVETLEEIRSSLKTPKNFIPLAIEDDVVGFYSNDEGDVDADPTEPRLKDHQEYLNEIEASEGHQRGGGKGICVVDVEYGWALDHVDLPSHMPAGPLFGQNKGFECGNNNKHGTKVLGVLFMQPNLIGGTGVVPNAIPLLSSVCVGDPMGRMEDVTSALLFAAQAIPVGHVMLIEIQSRSGFPLEHFDTWREVLRVICDSGVVVVEPAGNSGHFLDREAEGDSGSIMVGALNCASTGRNPPSNRGSRVDCWANGHCVGTINSTSPTAYAVNFNGTSAASAIVAGVAAAIQGGLSFAGKPLLRPEQLRTYLVKNSVRIPSPDGDLLRPNLAKVFKALGI